MSNTNNNEINIDKDIEYGIGIQNNNNTLEQRMSNLEMRISKIIIIVQGVN